MTKNYFKLFFTSVDKVIGKNFKIYIIRKKYEFFLIILSNLQLRKKKHKAYHALLFQEVNYSSLQRNNKYFFKPH
ncbi:MAG TPA: hypothetical protein DDE71_06920 [Tenacibaculum sp.]|nr:hypothetical protein [Tenacibaculum sp.]